MGESEILGRCKGKVLAIIENKNRILVGRLKPEKIDDFGGLEFVFPDDKRGKTKVGLGFTI